MRAVKLLITILLALAVLLTGVLFTIHNTTPVVIDLVWIKLPEASLSIWLISTLVVGVLIGMVLTSARSLSLRVRLMSSNRKQRIGGGGTGLGSFRLDTIPSQPFYIARAFAPSTASRSPSAVSLRFTVEDFR